MHAEHGLDNILVYSNQIDEWSMCYLLTVTLLGRHVHMQVRSDRNAGAAGTQEARQIAGF